MRQNLPAQG